MANKHYMVLGEETKATYQIILSIVQKKLKSSTNKTHMPDYFHSNKDKETDKRVNETITSRIHNKFNELFPGL